VGDGAVSRSRKGQPGAIALLDEGADLVTTLPPFLAVLWLTALPARLLLAAFVVETTTKASAQGAGRYVYVLAYATLAVWLVSLYGRQVFIRACRRAMEGDTGVASAGLRVPAGELAGAVLAAFVVELTFWGLLFTVLVPVAMLPGGALAAVAAPRAGPRLWKGLREMASSSGSVLTLAFLLLLCLVALCIALVNLHLVFALSVALLGSVVAPLDLPAWGRVLSGENPLYMALLLAGASLLVEPFWLAAMTVHVERVRAQSSGEDLRQAFEDIRRRDTEQAA
jgi:hypothetical protein